MEKATLIKVLPIKRKINNTCEYDSLMLWYRDEAGNKKLQFVPRAQVPYYMLKDKESQEAITPPMFIEADKVEKYVVYSDVMYREIAMKTDSLSYYDRVTLNFGPRSSNLKNLLKHNLIYNADMDVADRYIKDFNESHEQDMNYKLHKCYMDIEVDLMENGWKKNLDGKSFGYIGFPEEDVAPCPVNIISLIDGKSLIAYLFVCRNQLNKKLVEYEKFVSEHMDEKVNEIKVMVTERNGITLNDIKITFYNSEEETIAAYFNKTHEIDPDVILSWNQKFDVITMMNRLKKLYNKKKELREQGINGYDQMLSTVCDSKYMLVQDSTGKDMYLSPCAKYKTNPQQKIVDRMDEFVCLDGINYLDQMLVYANVRKSTIKESYSLEAIAEEEIGVGKLDYSHGNTIKTLPWNDFDLFLKYNLFDTVTQMCIENKTLDTDMLQRLSEITNTRLNKVFKKTISIKNFVNKFAEKQGFVMGNNKNAQYGDDGAYYESQYLNKKTVNEPNETYIEAFNKKENFGAYVGNPKLNGYDGIEDASGHPSMYIFENVFDDDFSSLYPSIIRAYNLDKNTQVGKFFLVDSHIKEKLVNEYGYSGLFQSSKNDEADGEESSDDIGPTLVDSLTSQNWSRIGEKYFDLPSTTEMIDELINSKK